MKKQFYHPEDFAKYGEQSVKINFRQAVDFGFSSTWTDVYARYEEGFGHQLIFVSVEHPWNPIGGSSMRIDSIVYFDDMPDEELKKLIDFLQTQLSRHSEGAAESIRQTS